MEKIKSFFFITIRELKYSDFIDLNPEKSCITSNLTDNLKRMIEIMDANTEFIRIIKNKRKIK